MDAKDSTDGVVSKTMKDISIFELNLYCKRMHEKIF